MGDNATTPEETASASSIMDRRRMLQVGTAGVVAVGAVAAGAPQVLGLSSSPLYAAAASGPGTTTPPPPNQSSIIVQLNLSKGGSPYVIPATYPGITANLYAADGTTIVQSSGVNATKTSIALGWVFFGLTAGTYYVDFTDTLGQYVTADDAVSGSTPPARVQFVITTTSQSYSNTSSAVLT